MGSVNKEITPFSSIHQLNLFSQGNCHISWSAKAPTTKQSHLYPSKIVHSKITFLQILNINQVSPLQNYTSVEEVFVAFSIQYKRVLTCPVSSRLATRPQARQNYSNLLFHLGHSSGFLKLKGAGGCNWSIILKDQSCYHVGLSIDLLNCQHMYNTLQWRLQSRGCCITTNDYSMDPNYNIRLQKSTIYSPVHTAKSRLIKVQLGLKLIVQWLAISWWC